MKAAWTCRACSRRLLASLPPRLGLQAPTLRRIPPNRWLASEASAAGSAPADADDPSTGLSFSRTNRFLTPSQPRTTASTENTRDVTDKENLSNDTFEAAFSTRRGDNSESNSGRRKGRNKGRKNRKPPKELVDDPDAALWLATPKQIPTLSKIDFSYSIDIFYWRNICRKIRNGEKIGWDTEDEILQMLDLDYETISKAWSGVDTGVVGYNRVQKTIWNHLLLTAMITRPEKAPMILSASLAGFRPHPQAFKDVLTIIKLTMDDPNLGKRTRRDMAEHTHDAVLRYIRSSPSNPGGSSSLKIWPEALGTLSKFFSRSQILQLVNAFQEFEATLPLDTALHFASRLGGLRASDEHREKAIRIIEGLVNQGHNLNEPKVASIITTILHQKSIGEKSKFAPMQVLQYLMEKGSVPNAAIVTAVIETLGERGEFPEALRLAKLFADNGLKLDDKAFEVVLKGAVQTLDNERLREAFDFCWASGATHSQLAKFGLHAIYLRVKFEDRAAAQLRPSQPELLRSRSTDIKPRDAVQSHEALISMLRFFMERFELKALQSLVPQTLPYLVWNHDESAEPADTQAWDYKEELLPMLQKKVPLPKRGLIRPCNYSLALILRAYVKSLWRPYDLMSMYDFFKGRLRHPEGEGQTTCDIVKAHGSLIHDSFILAMMQTHALVRPALEVFGDMLKDNSRDSTTGIHPPPSVYTFSIILAGLGRHREYKLFDNLVQIMKENGITPNLATTNTLVKSYALRQDTALTVGALRDLETLGYFPDQYTYDAFDKLKDQKRALDMMARIIDENTARSPGTRHAA